LALALTLFLWRGMTVTGFLDGDEIAHYLHLRFLGSEPLRVLDRWGRPLFAAAYAPAAALGFPWVKGESALVAALACALTYAAARAALLPRALLVIPLLALQPGFLEVSSACLPEALFATLIAAGLFAYARNAERTVSALVALAPLVRLEGVVLVALWALYLATRRRWLSATAVWLPLAAWNVYWVLQPHTLPYYRPPDWLDLAYPFDSAFRSGTGDYARGRLLYYPLRLPSALGWAVTPLALLGLISQRPLSRLAGATALLFLATYSLLYRFVPGAAVAGYLRHLVALSPAAALLAVDGVGRLMQSQQPGWLRRLATAALAAGLVAGALGARLPTPSADEIVAVRAVDWLRSSGLAARRVLSSSVWVHYHLDRDPYDLSASPLLHRSLLTSTKAGDLIAWDPRLGPRSWIDVPRPLLETPDFVRLREFRESGASLEVFERQPSPEAHAEWRNK
jgi:hypothetical protein